MKKYSLDSKKVEQSTNEWLKKRGIERVAIAELVLNLQRQYYDDLTLEECLASIDKVLAKREVQNAVLTGIQLDILADEGKLFPPLQDMIEHDEGLYGCDEILALSIVNVYGSIGLTNFGYLDKVKPGIIGELNDKKGEMIHTFLDDIIGAIAASAASSIAHNKQKVAESRQAPPADPKEKDGVQ
ncbi:phosphatidylglycerophosphatase A family protein [Paenibacillus senegalensis]|uniref:phosphatidylglycerophosphatase A family protein n=1 Tax=Paenibacillus senegalensis TaxID=1465766 RepID=UPI0002895A90